MALRPDTDFIVAPVNGPMALGPQAATTTDTSHLKRFFELREQIKQYEDALKRLKEPFKAELEGLADKLIPFVQESEYDFRLNGAVVGVTTTKRKTPMSAKFLQENTAEFFSTDNDRLEFWDFMEGKRESIETTSLRLRKRAKKDGE